MECVEITDDRPLKQGDIFEWMDNSLGPFYRYGIVVTADCDITNQKHNGTISYVPLITVEEYLKDFRVPKLIEKGLQGLCQEVVSSIQEFQKKFTDFSTEISTDACLLWVSTVESSKIANDLGVVEDVDRDRLISAINNYLTATAKAKNGSLSDLLSLMLEFRTKGGKKREKAAEELQNELINAVDNLPGDFFFVSKVSVSGEKGYVAYLRLVREIHQNEIALTYADMRNIQIKGKRVARLQSPFVYRMTQKLASVFSDIGLPTEYDTARRTCVSKITSVA